MISCHSTLNQQQKCKPKYTKSPMLSYTVVPIYRKWKKQVDLCQRYENFNQKLIQIIFFWF